MTLRIVQFLAIVLTAVALVPLGSHLASLPNKMNLPVAQYFVVQGSYRGWWLFAFAQIPAVIVSFVLAVMLWRQAMPFRLALFGAVCMAATLAVYFIWVNPANIATEQWTSSPAHWEALRRHWEYGHAASAAFAFFALCSVTLAALLSRE